MKLFLCPIFPLLINGQGLLSSLLNPFGTVISEILSGNGLIDGALGAVKGVLGVEATFDYVVVGGGTAGNAIGTRLAEAGHSVAILEAGLYYQIGKPVLSTAPLGDILGVGTTLLDSNPLVDWSFVTEPQLGVNNRRVHYARGKCLGGSSALNILIYQRGTKESFDKWATMVDDASYTFDNVLPFYEKSAQFTPPNTNVRLANATTEYDTSVFTSSGGPLQVSYTNYVSTLSTLFKSAIEKLGIPSIKGFNSGSLLGNSYCTSLLNPKDQTRSASTAYIDSALKLSNLKVYTQTLAQKIVFNDKTATGVHVQSLGIDYTIHASKEVIISAGAFQSPQLLMVSGVGPTRKLNELGIDVISDLPGVGQNMWDHILFGPTYQVSIKTLSSVLKNPVNLAAAVLEYATNATGPLTSPVGDFIGWEKLPSQYRTKFSQSTVDDLAKFPSDWPEVELVDANGFIGKFYFPVLDQFTNGRLDQNFASFVGGLIAPTSRGNITINSTSTLYPPVINPNWLTTKTDQEVAVALYRRLRDIAHTEPLKSILVQEFYPGTGKQSDKEILEVIKESFSTFWHASCTCSMGVKGDKMAVLDSEARVFGVKGLRVVDSSSFPLLPPGHPQSTVYMLAEKIAHRILNP